MFKILNRDDGGGESLTALLADAPMNAGRLSVPCGPQGDLTVFFRCLNPLRRPSRFRGRRTA